MADERNAGAGPERQGTHAAPPPAPSHQGDGEEAGTVPRPQQGESERSAAGAGNTRAEPEPRSEVHKINHGDKLDSVVPRRERNS